ncbi:MAG: hypothetical protein QNJ00_03205 [Woeseiaceae bacterium]|nr:hypothetical protein [Woeseiaceae bacterium]
MMRRSEILVVVLVVCSALLGGCATQKDPIWLDAGQVRMADYTDKKILVFPVETSPSYRLSEGQQREIQDLVSVVVEEVFELTDLNSPDNIRRFDTYPYTLDEVQNMLSVYRADGAFVISVFNYRKLSQYNPDTLGVRIAFVGSGFDGKAWATTREYIDKDHHLIGSPALESRIKTDMFAVERALRSGNGFSGFVGSVFTLGLWRPPPSAGPRLSVSTETRGSTQIGSELGGTIDTKQSTYSILVTAEDEDGVASLVVSNLSTRQSVPLTIRKSKDGSFTHLEILSVDLDLRPGRNKIEIESTNSKKKRTVRRLVLNRIENQDVFALGVDGSAFGQDKKSVVPNERLAEQFDKARKNVEGDVYFLRPNEASFRRIMTGLDQVYRQTSSNSDSVGVFYYYGELLEEEDELFLRAYDSELGYADITSIPLRFLEKRMQDRSVVILDICEHDVERQQHLRDVLPYALVSFDSCGPDNASLADDIYALTEGGMSLRSAINTVYDARSQEQRQRF